MALSALPGFDDDQTSMVALRAPVLPSLIPPGPASTSNLDPMAGKRLSPSAAQRNGTGVAPKAASNIPVQQVTPLTPGQLNEFETRLGQAGGRRIGGRRIGGKGGPGGTYVRGEFRGKTPSQAVAQMKEEYQGGRQPGAVAQRPAGGPTPGGIDGYNAMQRGAGRPVTPSARIPLSSVTPMSTLDAAREFRNSPAAQAAQDLLAYNHFIQTVDWKKYQTPAPVKPVAPAAKPASQRPVVPLAAATPEGAAAKTVGVPAPSPAVSPAVAGVGAGGSATKILRDALGNMVTGHAPPDQGPPTPGATDVVNTMRKWSKPATSPAAPPQVPTPAPATSLGLVKSALSNVITGHAPADQGPPMPGASDVVSTMRKWSTKK